MKTTLGIVDDHRLFTKSMALLLNSFKNFTVVIEAHNGFDLQEKLSNAKQVPDILLIDVSMPVMNGIETARWMRKEYPQVRLVALSTDNSDATVLAMIRSGCCSYLIKDTEPDELENALEEIRTTGFYNADLLHNNFVRVLRSASTAENIVLNANELELLKQSCTDYTYKEIADKMGVNHKTLDKWRDGLFTKLNVKSRVGMVLEAIRRQLVEL